MVSLRKISKLIFEKYRSDNGNTIPKLLYYEEIKKAIEKNIVTAIDVDRIYDQWQCLDDIYLYYKTLTETWDKTKSKRSVQEAEDLHMYMNDDKIEIS